MAETKEKKEKKEKAAVTREEFDALAATVRGMKANWKKFAERNLGAQAPGGKIVIFLAACMIGAMAFGTDYSINLPNTDASLGFRVNNANGNTEVGGTLAVSGAVDANNVTVDAGAGVDNQAAGTLVLGASTATKVELADTSVETEVQGTLDVNGNADFDGTFTLTANALNVTNGQAVTVAAGSYVLNGIGGANDSTNTITLAAPAAAGEIVYLAVATASTNLVTIADSGTVAASGAILMDTNDACLLMALDTSTWALVSESDN